MEVEPGDLHHRAFRGPLHTPEKLLTINHSGLSVKGKSPNLLQIHSHFLTNTNVLFLSSGQDTHSQLKITLPFQGSLAKKIL